MFIFGNFLSALASIVNWLWELRNKSKISTLFHQRVREEGVHPSLNDHRRIFKALQSRDAPAASGSACTSPARL